MNTQNLLVFIHGMTIHNGIESHTVGYNDLWEKLIKENSRLRELEEHRVFVEYAHTINEDPPDSVDKKLSIATEFIQGRVGYESISRDGSNDNHTIKDNSPLALIFRRTIKSRDIKENVVLLGFSDAIYYASHEGGCVIRRSVFKQILDKMKDYKEDDTQLKLHILAHSLGVAVAYDFVEGLCTASESDSHSEAKFIEENPPEHTEVGSPVAEAVDNYKYWQKAEQDSRLKLGSFTTVGGQLPLLLMKEQRHVDSFAEGKLLSPDSIGIEKTSATPKWNIFYDIDDFLGFPTRRLFESRGSIKEYQVNTGKFPNHAHNNYWNNNDVIEKTANLIVQNL